MLIYALLTKAVSTFFFLLKTPVIMAIRAHLNILTRHGAVTNQKTMKITVEWRQFGIRNKHQFRWTGLTLTFIKHRTGNKIK